MILLAIGCNFRKTPVEVRERLAFDNEKISQALQELESNFGCEAVVLNTCNRVEVYLANADSDVAPHAEELAVFLGRLHQFSAQELRPHLYEHTNKNAVRHLFRVVSSLDSLIVGEGQIAGQVKKAYDLAKQHDAVGPYLHALFQHANQVSKCVRTKTGIALGHVSISSAAVDYVRQVFDRFVDKTVLVIGAGKMGELTLKHLQTLNPKRILVTNRDPEKANRIARHFGGQAILWGDLDEALSQADIVLSTTGSTEPIMTLERYQKIQSRRSHTTRVILDIAVPRDFDSRIHDGDRTCLFNIDDLKRIQEQTLSDRIKHVKAAEAIIDQEVRRFQSQWSRRQFGPIIAQLTQDFEKKRQETVAALFEHLKGKLVDTDRNYIEGAFRLLQNRFLHGPITALVAEPLEAPAQLTLLNALQKLFHL